MMRRSVLGATALAVGAVGGAVLGYLAERTVVDPVSVDGEVPEPATERSTLRAPDGTELAVCASGPADAPCILLVHGLSLSQEIWAAQRAALSRSWRVVSIDLRGHGDSADASTGDYSARALGADITTALDELGGDRCIVVGHSMGGMAALAGLADRPELVGAQVAGIVLMNTAASAVLSGLGGGSAAAGIAFVRERARSSLIGRMIYGGLDAEGRPRGNDLATLVTRLLGVGAHTPPGAVELVRRLVLASRPHVAGQLWRTVGTIDLLAVVRALSVPVLVVAGERDRVLPTHHSRRLVELLLDAELLTLPDVGHVAMLERPELVTAALDRFATRTLAPARQDEAS
jgi:pimeloyl-ACP methyl ester carboxylesterase